MLVLVKTVSELVRCRANDAGQDCWSYCSRRDDSQAFVDLDSRRHTCRLGHRLDLISTSGHSFRIMFSFFRDSKNKKHLFFYNADSFQIKSSVSTSLFSPAAAPAPAVRVRDESGTGANTHHNTTQHNQAAKQVVGGASCASGYKWPLAGVFSIFFKNESAGEPFSGGWGESENNAAPPRLLLSLHVAAMAEECDIASRVSLFTWWAVLHQRPGKERK